MSISAVVLNKNGAELLKRALQSLAWCDEVIVIDDGSTDDSLRHAQKSGATIVKNRLKSFAEQRNIGLKSAHSDWVLFLDADEVVPKELTQEIQQTLKNTTCDAFLVQRLDTFMGTQLHYGETGNIWLLRLAKKTAGSWVRPVHETWEVEGVTGKLHHALEHNPHTSISSFLEKINHYTDQEAKHRKASEEKFSIFQLLVYPSAKFFVNYGIKLGFLDGFPGLSMAYMMSMHSLIVRIKMYEKTS